MRYRYGYGQWLTQTQGQNLADAIRAIQAEKEQQPAMDEFTVPLTPEQEAAIRDCLSWIDESERITTAREAIDAELAAIAERREQAKRTNKAALSLFRELRATPGVHVGRVQGRDASGRFAGDDE